jgi:diketogulonate reductase-like aldo/keto reductase
MTDPSEIRTGEIPAAGLGGGVSIPRVGLGVFQVPPAQTEEVVHVALGAGYRHIDTAAAYDNEDGVGRALASSSLPRDGVFVTTKLWNSEHGRDRPRQALEASLGRLGLDFVDLYLIHWPVPSHDRYVETWEALLDLQRDGLTRAAGVSNFLPEHLERVSHATGVMPPINQVEMHPQFRQDELCAYHRDHGIVTEAWSPLAKARILDEPILSAISERHGRTPAQVVLRWHLQLGNVVIPKSITPARIESNLDLFGFELSEAEMDQISSLDCGRRVGPDPATFSFGA